MDVHIWVSRNGIHWEDVGGDQAWIPNGPDGSFDHGIVYSLIDGPVEGDRSEAFYHGTNTLHFNAWILSRLRGGLDDPPVPGSKIFDEKTYNGRPYLSPPAPVGPGWAMYDCIWSWRRSQCSQVYGGGAGGVLGRAGGEHGAESEAIMWRRVGNTRSCHSAWEFRTNGFASRRAGEQEGVLTTHPLIFQGNRLTVNAAASAGRVVVEILDEEGSPLPGYGREEYLLEDFDSTQQEVIWSGKSDLAALRGQPVASDFIYRMLTSMAFRSANSHVSMHRTIAHGVCVEFLFGNG